MNNMIPFSINIQFTKYPFDNIVMFRYLLEIRPYYFNAIEFIKVWLFEHIRSSGH